LGLEELHDAKRVSFLLSWTKNGRQKSTDRIIFLCQLYFSVLVKMKAVLMSVQSQIFPLGKLKNGEN